MIYRSLGSTSLPVGEEEANYNMLALSRKERLFLVDGDNNILSYSLD